MQGATLEAFGRDPVGRYVRGETFVHFCAHPTLWGVLLWGRPTDKHALELGRSLVLELAPPARPHVSIVDASRLEGGDERAFRALERYVTHYAEPLRAWVHKLAIVRPAGLRGAIVAGAYEVLPRPYPVAVFDDAKRALDWLEPDPSVSSSALVSLSELTAAAMAPPFVDALRLLLDAHLDGLSLAEAARSLHVSERTLQRKLAQAKTTLPREMTHARVRAAKRLLADTDAPLTTVALEAGFASLQHCNAAFRKHAGVSPGGWRKKAREGSAG